VSLPDDAVWEVDASWGVPAVLALLASELGCGRIAPGVSCGGVFAPPAPARPPLPRPEGGRAAGPGAMGGLGPLQGGRALGRGVLQVTNRSSLCRQALRGAPADAAKTPPRPAGRLTAASLCATLAALQPEGCILVDESLTSGGAYWDAAQVGRGPEPSAGRPAPLRAF
jgi:acetolactate synthase-1/2/3 large subunit